MTFIGVAWKGDAEEYTSFLERHGVGGFDQIRDDTGEIFSSFGVRYQPGWAFIDDGGQIEIVAGGLGEAALEERVEQLVAS